MRVNNIESLPKEQLYFCYDKKIHDYLYNEKKINYIFKGIDKDGNTYHVYFKSVLLLDTLKKLG